VTEASFVVNSNEILGFVGPNGAGKSTVIRVLMNLINKTSGECLILNQEPGYMVNKEIGYLPSEVNLFPELTVLKQLEYFAKVRNVRVERIQELSKILDLDLGKRIKELSFGNRKKVGIVACMMGEPKVLILDEPTSGLDPLVQQNFFNLLLAEKNKGTAILLSSHVLSEVEKICDRVCFIKEGVTIFSDTIVNLKKSAYKKIHISPSNLNLNLLGLEKLTKTLNFETYSYKGDINDLLTYLTRFKITNLTIEDLDLEEIFLHYYDSEESNKGEAND
jgi:ABC-2 type transport system ATP-binding protein